MCAQLSDLFPHLDKKRTDETPSLRNTLDTYLFHWPLFIIGIILAISCAFFYLQFITPVYELKATILIKDKSKAPQEKSTLQELDITNSPKLAESEIEVLKSRALIDQVVSDLELWVDYQQADGLKKVSLYKINPVAFKLLDSVGLLTRQTFIVKIKDEHSFYLKKTDGSLKEFSFNSALKNDFGIWKLQPTKNIKGFIGKEITIILNDPDEVAQAYQKNIDAILINKVAPAIGLTLNDNVAQRGKDVLDDLMISYNKNNLSEKNQATQNTLDFIDKRIVSIAGELNNSEKELEAYRSSKGVTSISLQSQAYLDNMRDNDKQLNEVNVQLNIIDYIEKNLNSSQNIQNASASLGQNYPTLNSLIEKLSLLQLQRDKMLATTPENNPIFEPVNRQIKGAKNDIRESIQNIKISLLATKEKLQLVSSKVESSIHNLPGQERELIDKTRQKDIKSNLYTYLLQKREEIAMSYASTLPDAEIVDRAYTSDFTSKKTFTCGIAFLLGLILPAGFIYARNILNGKITTRREIEEGTDVLVFSELAYAKSPSKLVINDKNDIILSEEFKSLRTDLNFLRENKDDCMVVLLTSSISGEGKSFISSNLGLALAISGKKTIILELDLRKPQILGFLNSSSTHPGISDYLTDNASKEVIIQNSNIHPKLDVISSGSLPDDPSELLELVGVDSLIHWLKSRYDCIIIDSPPVNLVTDAKLLARLADFTLYVIRQGYTYKSLLPYIKVLIQEQKLPKIKLIFNAIEKGKYGYGYYYGNKYYNAMGKTQGRFGDNIFYNFSKRF